MIWTANTPSSYRFGDYQVNAGVQGWTVWLLGQKKIGEAPYMSEAMRIAEAHALQAP